MKNFFKATIFKVLLGVVLIISGVWLYTTTNMNNNIIANSARTVLSPIQKTFWNVSDSASEFILYFKDREKQRQENENLKRQLSQLRDLTVDYYEVKRENAKFVKYYDFKRENSSLKFVAATIIARENEELFYNFTIDQGSTSGISVNDVVVTENALVGSVMQVSANSALIKTIFSPDSKIGAEDVVTGEYGVISGNAKMALKNQTRMIYINAQNSLNTGDIVISSGLSGLYPKSLKIGEIKEVGYDSNESSYYTTVEPFDDIKSIKDVFVVTDFRGKGEIISQAVANGGEKINEQNPS